MLIFLITPLVVFSKSSDLPTTWNLRHSGKYYYTVKVTVKLPAPTGSCRAQDIEY